MKKTWGLQNSRSRMIALFIVDILSVILDSYLAIILRFKLDNIWVPAEYMYSVESYMVIRLSVSVCCICRFREVIISSILFC